MRTGEERHDTRYPGLQVHCFSYRQEGSLSRYRADDGALRATALGLAGPKGVSSAIVIKWEEAIDRTLKDPRAISTIEKIEGIVIDFKKGEDYKKELLADLVMFKEIAASLPDKK